MPWSLCRLQAPTTGKDVAEAELSVEFPWIDWTFLQSVYGWAALQYQAWVRGYINVEASSVRSYHLYTDEVLEFWLDDEHYFGGDLYAYRKAPLVLHLGAGSHQLDIRLIRDARAMGAVGEPTISIKLKLENIVNGLLVNSHDSMVSDIVNEKLAGNYASVPICNGSREQIEILDVISHTVCFCHGPI